MAWKFEIDCVRDGDVIEPSEIRKNVNEFFGEINGFLDADNIAATCITKDVIKRNALTQVLIHQQSAAWVWVFDHKKSGWVSSTKGKFYNEAIGEIAIGLPGLANPSGYDSSKIYVEELESDGAIYQEDQDLPVIEFDADNEGLLIVEFTGNVQWLPQKSNGLNRVSMYRSSHLWLGTAEYFSFFDDLAYSSGGTASFDAFDLGWYTEHATFHGKIEDDYKTSDGSKPLHPGQYGYFRNMETDLKSFQGFILCSMWRVTVNGMSVAETGPIGNEYSAHPIYLCGAIPVEGSKNNIIRVECQTVWYSPGLDQYKSASSEQATLYSNDGTPQSNMATNTGPSARIDCSLFNANLIATYRKR